MATFLKNRTSIADQSCCVVEPISRVANAQICRGICSVQFENKRVKVYQRSGDKGGRLKPAGPLFSKTGRQLPTKVVASWSPYPGSPTLKFAGEFVAYNLRTVGSKFISEAVIRAAA